MQAALMATRARFGDRLDERRARIAEDEEQRAEYYQDEAKERWKEELYELQNGRFADVDE
jgi:hypothetical protein